MSRKIKVPRIIYKYVDDPDSEANLRRAYGRIFELARQRIVEKNKIEKKKD
jgi:hypothetical protein